MKLKILLKVNAFLLSIIFFSLFFLSGFYIYYLFNYPEPFETDYLLEYYPEDFILKAGDFLPFPQERPQNFLNFPTAKESNSIRIGTFGDSSTFGYEVDKKASYPYLLQQLFNKHFPNQKIEVLNFGMKGASFQEQFLLWERYSKLYGLDYILLGPRGFYPNRDITFRISWNFQLFDFPKERFILFNDNELKQVHIQGNTLKERYKNYYRLIPSWAALRYDKKPFKIWEKFFPFLRHRIQNPFYYKNLSDEKESAKINILLMKKINAIYHKKILFFTDNSSLYNSYQSSENFYNLNRIPFNKNRFYMVFHHASSLENKRIANIYFNALAGRKKFSLKTIECYFKKIDFSKKRFDDDLYNIRSINIVGKGLGSPSVAIFKHNSSDHHHNNKGSYSNRKEKGIKSFIGFSTKYDFLDFPFFPLTIQLKTGMKLSIQLPDKSRIELGEVRALDQFNRFFVFYSNFTIKKQYQESHYESWFLLKKNVLFSSKENNSHNISGTVIC